MSSIFLKNPINVEGLEFTQSIPKNREQYVIKRVVRKNYETFPSFPPTFLETNNKGILICNISLVIIFLWATLKEKLDLFGHFGLLNQLFRSKVDWNLKMKKELQGKSVSSKVLPSWLDKRSVNSFQLIMLDNFLMQSIWSLSFWFLLKLGCVLMSLFSWNFQGTNAQKVYFLICERGPRAFFSGTVQLMRQSFKDGFSIEHVARDASLYIAERITILRNLRCHLAVFVAQVWLDFSHWFFKYNLIILWFYSILEKIVASWASTFSLSPHTHTIFGLGLVRLAD